MKNSFDVYKDFENEVIADKKLKIEGSIVSGLEHIIDFYENRFLNFFETTFYIAQDYEISISELRKIKYDFNDIKNFCLNLHQYSMHCRFGDTGAYISALISNITKDRDKITLNFSKNTFALDNFGVLLKKDVELTLVGTFGNNIGLEMKKGKIIVDGHVGNYTGLTMEGGKIIINGNAGHRLGRTMQGGEIIIKGNAGDAIGEHMNAGKIYLEGNYGNISRYIKTGKIYHKGELVYSEW